MAREWPFFDDLLAKIEMVCAKADPEIARLYFEQLGADRSVGDDVLEELQRTINAVLAVRQRHALLEDQPVLRSTISLRNPYVDPLSILQASLLRRKRRDGLKDEDLDAALGTTLNGIAQGLRNTG